MEIDVHEVVLRRLESYGDLNFLEHYAMFMGKAQLLELGLKKVLIRDFEYAIDRLERSTLGGVKNELAKSGVREDFIRLLERFIEYRNDMAHEFLATEAFLRGLVGDTGRLSIKPLERGTYELEQLLVIFDFNEEHKCWAAPAE
jgi:hypothetical protein